MDPSAWSAPSASTIAPATTSEKLAVVPFFLKVVESPVLTVMGPETVVTTKLFAQWVNTARATNPAKSGFYFFDTQNGLNPQGAAPPGVLAPPVEVNSTDDGNIFKMMGFVNDHQVETAEVARLLVDRLYASHDHRVFGVTLLQAGGVDAILHLGTNLRQFLGGLWSIKGRCAR